MSISTDIRHHSRLTGRMPVPQRLNFIVCGVGKSGTGCPACSTTHQVYCGVGRSSRPSKADWQWCNISFETEISTRELLGLFHKKNISDAVERAKLHQIGKLLGKLVLRSYPRGHRLCSESSRSR